MKDYQSVDKLVKKEIIKEGEFSNKPTEAATCHIYVKNPQSFDVTIQQLKQDFHSEIVDDDAKKVIIIGDANSTVDRLLERAIQTMCINEQSLVTVEIPLDNDKNKSIVMSIEITLEKVEFYKPIWEWSVEEKYASAVKNKEKGVELFKTKRYVDAFHKFSKACKILITLEPIEEEEEHLQKVSDLKYILYNNMAECQLVRKNYEHVLTLCNKILSKDEHNVKALYRRGMAHAGLRNFEQASNDLKTVINLEPQNKQAQEKYKIYHEKWQISVQKYEDMVRKMFKA